MKHNKLIEQEVEKTLNSLDQLARAEANPYLFTRIKSRLKTDERNFWSQSLAFISRPAVAITTILLAVFVNVFVFVEFRSAPSGTSSAREGEQLFATEYDLAGNTIYDSTVEPE